MFSGVPHKTVRSFFFFLIALALLAGCSTKSEQPQGVNDLPPVSNTVGAYNDIFLPTDMKWDNTKSMAIKTESFRGGIYHYSGNVEVGSLKEFVLNSMQANKWKMVGEASYENTLIAFTKPNKTCMVEISEDIWGSIGETHIKLYVTVDVTAANRLNPFGEPIK